MDSNDIYKKIIAREKLARKQAEDLLEAKSRELYFVNQELKHLNEELESRIKDRTAEILKAKGKAEIASKSKTQFLSNVSHELRTPLNHILSAIQLLKSQNILSATMREVEIIEIAAKKQLDMINRIIEVSDLDSEISQRKSFGAISEVYAFIDEHLKSLSDKASFETTHMNSRFDSDIVCVAQITTFLKEAIDNAIRFKKSTQEKARIKVTFSKGLGDAVELQIVDHGVGMSKETIEKMEQIFNQADYSDTRAVGGLGLGFTIMNKVAKSIAGNLIVESAIEGETSIKLTIPVKATSSPSLIRPKKHVRKILVVEDVELNRELARAVLEQKGFTVITANDGAEAVEAYKSSSNEIDLILMDCQMPVMDGFEASRRIKAISNNLAPIFAVTASARDSTQEKCVEAGMEEFFTKPVDWEKLSDKIRAI